MFESKAHFKKGEKCLSQVRRDEKYCLYLNFEVGGFLIFLISSQNKFQSMLGK